MERTDIKLTGLHRAGVSVTIPDRNYFVRNEQAFRFCYSTTPFKIRYVVMMRGVEAAKFLKRFDKISGYAISLSGEVRMYTTSEIEISINGKLVIQQRQVPFYWEDVEFSYKESHVILSILEYERQQNEAPRNSGKVVGMFSNNSQKVA